MKVRLFLLFIIFPVLINAQSGKALLKKMQDKFNTITDFSADVVEKASTGEYSGKNSGTFVYKKQDKFRIEIGKHIIVSNGETLWNYDKKQNRVLINYAADEPSTFSIEKYVYDYPKLCRVKLADNADEKSELKVIELIPKDDDLEFKTAKLWIDNDNMLVKIEATDLSDTDFVIEFSKIKLNQNIPDSKFTLDPPKGSKIIDLR